MGLGDEQILEVLFLTLFEDTFVLPFFTFTVPVRTLWVPFMRSRCQSRNILLIQHQVPTFGEAPAPCCGLAETSRVHSIITGTHIPDESTVSLNSVPVAACRSPPSFRGAMFFSTNDCQTLQTGISLVLNPHSWDGSSFIRQIRRRGACFSQTGNAERTCERLQASRNSKSVPFFPLFLSYLCLRRGEAQMTQVCLFSVGVDSASQTSDSRKQRQGKEEEEYGKQGFVTHNNRSQPEFCAVAQLGRMVSRQFGREGVVLKVVGLMLYLTQLAKENYLFRYVHACVS